MAGFFDQLEQAIGKHGGEDEAYKLKLKTGIRESLGYSNYVSQRKRAAGESLDLSLLEGNITPGGVKQLVGGAIDTKEGNLDTIDKKIGAVDSASEQLATAQMAREKAASTAARSKMGLENGIMFQPQNPMEAMVNDFMQNPKNPDGSMKSVQQLEAEMNASLGMQEGYSSEDIKRTLEERMPADYMGNEDKYFMMSMGFSEKQALENAGALRYGEMTDTQKLIYESQNPGMAKLLNARDEVGDVSQLVRDATETKTVEIDGQTASAPKYTLEELQEKYPNMTPAEVKRLTIAPYKKAITEDIEASLGEVVGKKKNALLPKAWEKDESRMDQIRAINGGEISDYKEGGMVSVKKSFIYKELKEQLKGFYAGTFTDAEIDEFLFDNINPRL